MSDDTAASSTDLSPETATRWHQEIARYEKWSGDWKRKSERLLKLYGRQRADSSSKRKFAMLWANTEVMKPAVYAQPPVPQVSRRYKDQDKVGRVAAELLERSATFSLEQTDIDSKLRHVRDDVLLPGRGTVWLRVETDPDSNQKLVVDYVHWKDFGFTPGRVWEEVTAVWHWSYMTKTELKARFPDTYKDVPLDHKAVAENQYDSNDTSRGIEAKAAVAEIWDKTSKKVYFISKAHPTPLEVIDPFLNLQNFWPTPKPVFATLTSESLIPTPDYAYYRDQAEEIDQLTGRIDRLTDNLKLVGFYPSGSATDIQQAVEKALNPNTENTLVPIESWAEFAEKGGQNIISWLPLKDVVTTIQSCIELRSQLIQDVYQITGISDVLRGASDPQETATAQTLKAQWGSIRIRDRQTAIAKFARDIVRIACEIMAENFDFMTLRQMANMMPQAQQTPNIPALPAPPSQPMPQVGMAMPDMGGGPDSMSGMNSMPQQGGDMASMPGGLGSQASAPPAVSSIGQPSGNSSEWDEAIMPQVEQLLKSDKLRSFRVDIETDSTIQADEDAEKQRRTEFITAISGFLQQALPVGMQMPALGPMMGEALLFLVRGFRAGRGLEDAIDRAISSMGQAGATQAPPPPDPTTMKVQAEQPLRDAELQLKQGDIQIKAIDAQIKQAQLDAQMRDQGGQPVDNGELGIKQQQVSLQAQQQGAEEMRKQRELALQEAQHNHAVWQSQQDLALRHRELTLKERQHTSAEADGAFNRDVKAKEVAAAEKDGAFNRTIKTKELAQAGKQAT